MNEVETSVRLCLIGKPALFIEGRLQPFAGPRKSIALLAYLVLHGDRMLSRAALAEQFWPDEDAEDARASLRRHLYRGLGAFPEAPAGRPWILADKVTVRWNPHAAIEVDTQRYERLSAAGDRAGAVALYRGDYLADFYDDWVLPERERLRDVQSGHLIALIDERRRALDYHGAISFAQMLLRLDPLREDAMRRLMTLRFAAGDRSGALADFDAFRRKLREELDAEPMPETIALCTAIRKDELRPFDVALAPEPAGTRHGFPFVGRADALHRLCRAWESSARGASLTAVVSGEAGVGKSRLIAELVAAVEAQGGNVVLGTTSGIESEPYQAVVEALRRALTLARLDRLDALRLGAIATLVPSVADDARDVADLPHLAPERERQRLFDAIEAVFEQICDRRPLLVVLEDLHWAGTATIELLDFLVRRLRTKRVLVVISYREEETSGSHPLGGFLRRLQPATTVWVALGPLSPSDIRSLVATSLADADTYADDLFTASEGHALFATELLRERLAGTADAPVPASIARTVSARIERLAPAALQLVETAAVVGIGFDLDVVRRICGWNFAETYDALDELLDRGLVRTSTHRKVDVAFSHALVHSAIYATIAPPTLRRIHRRTAKTLERLFPQNRSLDAAVARHLDAAGFTAEAIPRYVTAAQYALSVYAHDDAIALATRALELAPCGTDRFELLRLREEAASRSGAASIQRGDCAEMAELARDLADDDLLGAALCRAIAFHAKTSEREAEARAIAELRAIGPSASGRWEIEAVLAQARFDIADAKRREADAALRAAEPRISELDDDALAFAYWFLRAFLAIWLDLPNADLPIDRARAHVRGDRMRDADVARLEARIADARGDAAALERGARRQLEICAESGDLEGQAFAHKNLANVVWYRFDVAANREHTERALALFERLQQPLEIAYAIMNRGALASDLGDFEAADAAMSAAREIADGLGNPHLDCIIKANVALNASAAGLHERARELALDAFAFATEHELEVERYILMECLGHCERELGRFEAADELFETALRWRRERDPRALLETLIEVIPTYVGLGSVDRAVAAADELLQGLAHDRMIVHYPAQALATAAAAYAAAGETERAHTLQREAQELLRALADRIPGERERHGYLSLRVHDGIFAPQESGRTHD